jgi:hypothetical protein
VFYHCFVIFVDSNLFITNNENQQQEKKKKNASNLIFAPHSINFLTISTELHSAATTNALAFWELRALRSILSVNELFFNFSIRLFVISRKSTKEYKTNQFKKKQSKIKQNKPNLQKPINNQQQQQRTG